MATSVPPLTTSVAGGPEKKGIDPVALVRYLYFLRFSIMLWLFFPFFAVLDWSGVLSAMSRGIVAVGAESMLESGLHLVFSCFFVVMAGWIALLSARVVCAYGEERFECPPPHYLAVDETRKMSWRTFWTAQIPGFLLLIYMGHATFVEQGDRKDLSPFAITIFLVLGIVLALLCWTLMAGIYYWMFWQPSGKAKPFLVPYAGLFQKIERDPPSTPLLALLRVFDYAARLGRGYADPARGLFRLHSGHAFAFLTLGFLAAIYIAFWDFTAPIELERVRWTARVIFVAAALVWAALSIRSLKLRRKLFQEKGSQPKRGTYLVRLLVLFAPLLAVVWLPFGVDNHPFAMPVLAFVTVLVTFVCWGLGGLAFFLDRFRVPVLTSVVAVLIVFNLLFGKWAGTDEHYITSYDLNQSSKGSEKDKPAEAPKLTPSDILKKFEDANSGKARPVIIVTATGGGIHAAMWTSAALNQIEKTFGNNLKPATFHDSILMMSTVSGGSVGVAPWLRHYLDHSWPHFQSDSDIFKSPEIKIAGCSDLQAIAWGLVYADFLRVLWPFRFSSIGRALNTYDRGWALEQAFGRNQKAQCDSEQSAKTAFDISAEEKISNFDPEKHPGMPAFSLNTTAEETGARFLIANYDVERGGEESEITSAHSFLPYFQQDLPLSIAARLSANFPYVSPMPRLKQFENPDSVSSMEKNRRNYHFGDGGYFDNDGTSSAMEFLWYAFNKRPAGSPRVPVLIVEIRDGDDPSGAGDRDPGEKAWSGQSVGPVATFYNANHVSVTRRNRRELCFMEKALEPQASFAHIILPFNSCPGKKDCSPGKQALSWHLTVDQKLQMHTAIDNVESQMKGIEQWYANPELVTVLNPGESSYRVGDRIERTVAERVNGDLQRRQRKAIEYEPIGCERWEPINSPSKTE